jgi:hypothetical protein
MIRLNKFKTLTATAFLSVLSISALAAPARIPYFALNIIGMGPTTAGSPHLTKLNAANGNENITYHGNATDYESALTLITQSVPQKGSFYLSVCNTTKQPACAYGAPIARLDYDAPSPIALGFTSLNVVNLQPNTPGNPQVSWDSSSHTITVNGNGW